MMANFTQSQVAEASAQFGLKFMNSTTMDNVVISPYSLQNMLIMIILGVSSKSPTQKSLFKVLGYDDSEVGTESLRSILTPARVPLEESKSFEESQDERNFRFNQASLLAYNKDRVVLNESYVNGLNLNFNVDLLSYSPPGTQTKPPIYERANNWVANKTNNLIKDIVQPGDFQGDSIMSLIDAIYFKGNWKEEFFNARFQMKSFYNQGSQPKNVTFMRGQQKSGYLNYSELDCQVLESHFISRDSMSMVILLPSKRDGLDELQAKLTGPILSDIYKKIKKMKVDVELPKFTLEQSHDAKETLIKMGAGLALGTEANFDLMFEKVIGKPTIDKMLHKTKISVDENGVEAAAVTYVQFTALSLAIEDLQVVVPKFIADHPFLFILRHRTTDLPLFMGRVSKL